ncbi:MAG: cytochrome c [Lautropia sp.]|nr:cytochrome c [Lautropia sp.]
MAAGFSLAAVPAAGQGSTTKATAGTSAGASSAGQSGPPTKGDMKAAEAKIGMCIGCHAIPGYKASYPMVYSVPMIHGQTGKYIEISLNAYRSGDRSHPTMRAIAGGLSDQDIADLAAYYGKSLEKK